MGHKQWNDNQTQALLEYVIANFGLGRGKGICWSKWDSDGVEGFKKAQGQGKLLSEVKKENDGKNWCSVDIEFYKRLLAKRFAF